MNRYDGEEAADIVNELSKIYKRHVANQGIPKETFTSPISGQEEVNKIFVPVSLLKRCAAFEDR